MCLQEVQEDHYKEQIKPSLECLGTVSIVCSSVCIYFFLYNV